MSLTAFRLLFDCGDEENARTELAAAKELAQTYDRAPSSRASDIRFFEGPETTCIYSFLGDASTEATVEQTFFENGRTEVLEAFWESV